MKVSRVVVGELEENCYLIEKEGQVLIVDPGSDFTKIKEVIGDRPVLKVLLSHHHFDHIGALKEVIREYGVEVLEYQNLKEQSYTVGPFHFQVIFNPGHTNDSVSYYFEEEKVMFVGDFVFRGSVGRWDLATGNRADMQKSIEKLRQYPEDITLYPGHGESTTLQQEIQYNPYFS